MTVGVRPALDSDRPFLVDLFVSARAAAFDALPLAPAQKVALIEQQFAAQAQHYATYVDTTFDVVLVDGERAGQLVVGHWDDREHLAEIALLPAVRGRGIGTLLIEQVVSVADRRGVPTTVQVDRTNPAGRLYSRLGFRPVGPDLDPIHRLLERPPAGQS